MREVIVERVSGWIESEMGTRLGVDGLRFTTSDTAGEPVIYESRASGPLAVAVGKTVVRAQAFLQDHLSHAAIEE